MPYIGNKYEIGDHNNSWKTLDDISSYVATFDGSSTNAVSTTNNTIRVPEHRFIQGQRVTYNNGGTANIGGLTRGTAYYIIHDTNNEFKLATSLANANASTAINLSAVGSGTSHTVTAAFDGVNKKFKITYSGGRSSRFTSATQLSVAINNILQRPNDTTTFTDGFGISDNEKIVFNVAPVAADIFWGNILSASLPTFDISDNKLDNFTGNGSTTDFTLSHIPANNESIIVTVNGVVQHPTDKNGTRAYSLDASVLAFTAAPANGDEIQVRHIGFAGASSSAVTGFYGRTGNVTLSSSADDAIVGVITATKFSGPFVGTITGGNDIIAGIITATKIDLNGDIDVDGHTNLDNVSIAGVTTAAGAIDLNADLDVDGHTNLDNVSIAGVTTFAGNVDFSGGNSFTSNNLLLGDNRQIKIGQHNDAIIYSDGTDTIYSHGAGGLVKIESNFGINIGGLGGGKAFAWRASTNSAELYFGTNKKFETTNTGAVVTGILTATDFSGAAGGAADFPNGLTGTTATFSGNVSVGGTLTYEDVTNVDAVGVITARNGIKDGTLTSGRVVYAGAGGKLSDDADLTYDGTTLSATGAVSLAGPIVLQPGGTAWSTTNNRPQIQRQADGELRLGAGSDSASNVTFYTSPSAGGTLAERLRIKSNGFVGIGTNNPESGQLQVIGNGYHQINISAHKTANANRGGGISFLNYEGDRTSIFQTYASNSSNTIYYGSADSSARGVQYHNFYVNPSRTATTNHALALRIDSSGHITPGGAGTQDLGSTSKEFRNLYIGNSGRVYLGDAQEVSLYHDGNNTYLSGGSGAGLMQIKNTGGGDVELFSNSNVKLRINGGENAVVCNLNNSVDLYFDASTYTTPKLKTSHTGITVDGEVASTQDYPNIRPALDFNFAAVKKLDPRMTFKRTGEASYHDGVGSVKFATENEPRFEHDIISGDCKGLMLEPAGTNYSYYSRRFETIASGSWVPQNGGATPTVTANTYTAPDGTSSGAYMADTITGATGTAFNGNVVQQQHTAGANVKHTFSMYIKLITSTQATIYIRDGGTGSVSSASAIPNTRNWQRVVVTSSAALTNSTTHSFYFGNTNGTIAVWGSQIERSDYVSSYIKTEDGANGTRDRDHGVRLDGEDVTDVFNQGEGTLIAEATPTLLTANQGLVSFHQDFGSVNRIELRACASTATSARFESVVGSSTTANIVIAHAGLGQSSKYAFAFQENNYASCVNGSTVATDTSGAFPHGTGINSLLIGDTVYSVTSSLIIKRVMYYADRLSNNQLVTLTS